MEVSDPGSVDKEIHKLSPEIQGMDALVLCAGLILLTEFKKITPDEWDRVIAVYQNGAFYTLQTLTPLLWNSASVVLASSVSAQMGVSH